MKKLFFSFILLTTLKSFSQSMPSFATVTDIQFNGGGCDASSARAAITSDLNYLSVLYDNFGVEIGDGTADKKAKKKEKSCAITVKIRIPAGWDFQFDSVEYRGFVALPNQLTAAYQFISVESEGGRGMAFDINAIQGPKMNNYSMITKGGKNLQDGSVNNSPLNDIKSILNLIAGAKNQVNQYKSGNLVGCSHQERDAVIKIKSRIGVGNLLSGLASFLRPTVKMVVDSTDASFQQKLKIQWSRCN